MTHSSNLIYTLILISPLWVNANSSTENDDLFSLEIEELLELNLTGAAVRKLALTNVPVTANPFSLSAFELPFSIDVIDRNTMRARGLKSVTEAADNLVGVISGESPAEPSSFSMRGFIRDSITVLRDGIKLGPASMTMRPHNTFNLNHIEIVKGPASLQYGHGSASGFINMITRKPILNEKNTAELFASKAKYNTNEWGLGLSGDINNTSAYRFDINQATSDGWVNQTNSESINITASLLWQPHSDINFLFSLDHLKDDLPAYWGTPLISEEFSSNPLNDVIQTDDNRVLENAMRFTNYNVADNRSDSSHLWSRFVTNWQLNKDIKINNTLYYFSADRAWKNAESYVFQADIDAIERDRFFVFHDHKYYGNQFNFNFAHMIKSMSNDISITLDYNKTDFTRSRGFPDGDTVTRINPESGMFGPMLTHISPTLIRNYSLNIEDHLKLSQNWRLFAGIRFDKTKLVRENFDTDTSFIEEDSFNRSFTPFSYHLNSHYQLNEHQAIYAHWSTAHDPVGSNLFLVNANENFNFTDIQQLEIGYKSIFNQGNTELTLAYFNIKRDNILLLETHDTVGNKGLQVSQGAELAISIKPTETLLLGGNLAYNHAKYKDFIDPDFGINASDNTPPNVPDYVANAWISQSQLLDLPIEIGGGVRYVSDRFTNFQNTVILQKYVTVNLFAAFTFDKSRVSLNLRNSTQQDYATWADIFYSNQVAIASPRTLEISFHTEL